jgi:hypothetical protein
MAAKQPSGRGLLALEALAELVAPVEGVGVHHLRPARDGGLDGAPHGLDPDEIDDGRQEAHHDDVEDHLPPELLGDARRRDREMFPFRLHLRAGSTKKSAGA